MRRLLIVAAAVGLALTGCGQQADDTGNQAGSTTAAPTSTTSPAQPTTGAGPAIPPCEPTVSTDTTKKPTVTFPGTCPPARTLLSKDVVTGTGEPLQAGQSAVVRYVGISLSSQEQFDASWDRGQPFTVQNVGQARVIDGWNQGLPGMRAGGRRLLVIPPELGYGSRGQGAIAPNETLVFVIDLVSISG